MITAYLLFMIITCLFENKRIHVLFIKPLSLLQVLMYIKCGIGIYIRWALRACCAGVRETMTFPYMTYDLKKFAWGASDPPPPAPLPLPRPPKTYSSGEKLIAKEGGGNDRNAQYISLFIC